MCYLCHRWMLCVQGMHEVLAPFVALSDPELPTSDISMCYSAFIKRFLPYAFNKDEEFLSLQVREAVTNTEHRQAAPFSSSSCLLCMYEWGFQAVLLPAVDGCGTRCSPPG